MPTKKKPAPKIPLGKQVSRAPDSRGKMPTRPQRSEAYESALTEYAAAFDLLHKHEYATALPRFRALEKANPDEPELAERSRTYAAFCERKLSPAPARPGTADDCYHQGVVRANAGKLEEAVSLFDQALGLEPSSARVLYARASTRALQGNTAAAVADLRQAIAVEPKVRHQAANDPDFEKIRDEAAFIDVIEPTPTGV